MQPGMISENSIYRQVRQYFVYNILLKILVYF